MRALIVTTVRDEGSFFLEWLAYHKAIGFTDFLVFSNDCSDGTDRMLDRLQDLGQIVHKPNPKRGKKAVQWQALNRASKHRLFKQADWALATDIDEFLLIHVGQGKLKDLIATKPDATGFAIAWRLFGNSGQFHYEDRPITQQFLKAAPEGMLWPWRAIQFKSLFRCDGTYSRFGVHRPRDPDPAAQASSRWYDGSGHLLRSFPGPMTLIPGFHNQYRLAQINHYSLGSVESFLVKMARGRAVHQHESIGLSYWIDRNYVSENDPRLWDRFGDEITERRKEMLDDEVLRDLHLAAVAWRHARIEALMQTPEAVYLSARIRQIGPSKVLPRNEQQELFSQLIKARQRRSIENTSGSRPAGNT
ncbi:MAG: glycosyltransferase family 2 protein [Ruegeria sp.]